MALRQSTATSQSTATPFGKDKTGLLTQLREMVDASLPISASRLLEYRQLQAAIASRRSLPAAAALERLVGRCWDELCLEQRARLLALAIRLRAGHSNLSAL